MVVWEDIKVRLVVKGFTQTYDLDYFEIFALVDKMTTVRLFIVITAQQNWSIKQLDVTNAFLLGDLAEEVYMASPPGYLELSSFADVFVVKDSNAFVCKLIKSIYSLKQARRCWFSEFSTALLKYNFIQYHTDNSLFTINIDKSFLDVLVYVDDILISGNDSVLL